MQIDFIYSDLAQILVLCSILLGVTDTAVETVFRTTEGFVMTWADWDNGQPNDVRNTNTEDCAFRSNAGGRWWDTRCDFEYKFYCEGKCVFRTSSMFCN